MSIPRYLLFQSSCKCTSTSTNLNSCKHSIPIQRSNISNSSIRLNKSFQQEQSEIKTNRSVNNTTSKAFEYTAPLWDKTKWFSPSGNNNEWRNWMNKSQANSKQSNKPTFFNTISKSISFAAKPPLPPKPVKTEQVDVDILIKNYLALREPTHRYLISLSNENKLGKMAKAIESKQIPVISSYLLDDLDDMRNKQVVLTPDLTSEILSVKETEGEEKEIEPRFLEVVDAKQEIQSLVDLNYRGSTLSMTLRAERPTLMDDQLLEELWTTFSNSHDISSSRENLHLAFSFLTYLVAPAKSNAPSDAKDETLYLPLALKIFGYLVENVLSDSAVASPLPDTSRSVTLQKVFLRTIVSASLDEGFHNLAFATLRSLALFPIATTTSKDSTSFSTVQLSADRNLVQETIQVLLRTLEDERQDTYRPRVPFSSPSTSQPLAQAFELLHYILPRYAYPPSKIDNNVPSNNVPSTTVQSASSARKPQQPVRSRTGIKPTPPSSIQTRKLPQILPTPVSPTITRLITGFIDEAGLRNRWDLVGKVWEYWGDGPKGKGYVMIRRRRKLLRWFSGEAPFSTYEPRNPNLPLLGEFTAEKSERVMKQKLFGDLAGATLVSIIRNGKECGQTDWSIQEKSDWINLLCSSKAANSRSREVARRFFYHFLKTDPPGAKYPFTLTGTAMLAMIRSNTPPIDRIDRKDLNTLVVNNYINTITSPASPYVSTEVLETKSSLALATNIKTKAMVISHYDLTVLAHAYSMMEDLESVSQVYQKLLSQKMLPDFVDIEVIIKTLSRENPLFARNFLALAHTVGAKIPVKLYKEVMSGSASYHRRFKTPSEGDLDALIHQAESNKMVPKDLRLLEAYKSELELPDLPLRKSEKTLEVIFKAIGLTSALHSTREKHLNSRSASVSDLTKINRSNSEVPIHAHLQEVNISALNQIMTRIEEERNYEVGILVYDKLLIYKKGVFFEIAFQKIIYTLTQVLLILNRTSQYTIPTSTVYVEFQKGRVKSRLKNYLHSLLDTTEIVQSKTFELAVRAALLNKDAGGVIKLLEHADKIGVSFSDSSKEHFRRRLIELIPEVREMLSDKRRSKDELLVNQENGGVKKFYKPVEKEVI